MATLNELVDQTVNEVSAYVKNQESVTIATQTVQDDDLTIYVDDTKAISKGMVEIDEELLYVKKSIESSGTIQILGTTGNPVGRGWRGTTATSHVAGSIVRNNPIFPRSQIKRALLDTIKGMNFPVLANESFTFNGSQYAYIMPDSLVDVTGVSWELPDSSEVWGLIKRWRIDTNYLSNGQTHQALILNEAPMPGKTVRVQYTKYPTAIDGEQELTESGLPSSCEDVVRFGAMYRLLNTLEPGKVIATAPSADVLDQPVAAGAATNAAKYMFQMYTLRLQEEVSKQQSNFLNIIQYQR